MSFNIQLTAVPNQQISATLEGMRYELTIKDCDGCMSVTIVRDGVTLCENTRAVAGFPLLNYQHQEGAGGNFIFTNEGDAMPDWRQFGVTQELIYTTAAELADIRNG